MEQDTDKLIEEQFKKLPVPLQRAITLTPWRNIVSNIAATNQIDPEKFDDLETEAMLVMYGFQSADDFESNIATQVGVPTDVAKLLAKKISSYVFGPIIAKADELAKEEGTTLQNTPEQKPETQEIAPDVVVEAAQADSASVNLIEPPRQEEEKLLEPPKPGASPVALAPAPSHLPASEKVKPSSIIAEKLTSVTTSAAKNPHYPDGKDPYREEI